MSAERSTEGALAAFLTSAIETVDRLDVLLLLHRSPSRSWSGSAVARELQLSIEASERELEALCARGLVGVSLGADVSYTFKPIDTELEALANTTAELHADRPAEVCALLHPSARLR